MGVPWTAEEDTTLRQLHARGLSQNKIGQIMGRSQSVVGDHGEKIGLAWDRSLTKIAVAAKMADVRERRAILAERHLRHAEELMDKLEAAKFRTKVKGVGGAERIVDLDFVPADEYQKLVTTLQVHEQSMMKLELHDAPRADALEISGPGGVPFVADGREALMAALGALNRSDDESE